MRFARLAQRLFNRPIAIHPRKAEIVMAALGERLGITSLTRGNGDTVVLASGAWDKEDDDEFTRKAGRDPGYDVAGPVAIVPIEGTLVQKLGELRPYSGMTGYDGIRQAFLTAVTDPAIEAIVLDVDSPGGEVAGCFDLVDTIYANRGSKPIWAILTECAYSAAYAIASAADRIVVPRTGGTGSIGVICMHVDWSRALGDAGLKVTFITSQGADRKTDGHPEIPLSKEALAAIQSEIDAMGEIFCATVGRNRGLDPIRVRDLAAGTFLGADGITAGLADAVMAPDEAFRALIASL